MPVSVLFLVYGLAVARLTGLITADEITRVPRDAVQHRLGRRYDPEEDIWAPAPRPINEALASLLTCQWCASIYVAAVAAPLVWFHGTLPWLAIPALALAFSQFTGMFSSVGRG